MLTLDFKGKIIHKTTLLTLHSVTSDIPNYKAKCMSEGRTEAREQDPVGLGGGYHRPPSPRGLEA